MLTHKHAVRLMERKLDPSMAQRYGVRSSSDGTALEFEYRVRGQVHNVKVRHGKGNMPWAQKDKPLVLWNRDCLEAPPAPDEVLIVTEGELDGLALLQAGFPRVVSVPNGAPSSPKELGDKRFAYLYKPDTADLLPDIAKFSTIFLAVDNDAPGTYLRDALAARLGVERCYWVDWPEGCKDANDALIAHGPQNLMSIVYGAKRMWTEYVGRMSDIPDAPIDPMYTIGQAMMDKDVKEGGLRLPTVGFVTLSGPANMGKSTWARQLCWHLWRTYGSPFLITALEEDAKPTYQHEFRLLAIGKPDTTWTVDEVGRADIEIDSAMAIIQVPINEAGLTVEALLASAELGIKIYGARVLLIDPANEIDRDSDPETTGQMIKALKAMAKKYRVLVIVVAHPPTEVVRRKTRYATDLWTLYDVEGGRHWAGKSDVGMMLWRVGEHTMLHVSKLKRFREMGRPMLYKLRHDMDRNTLEAIAKGYHLLEQAETDKAVGFKPKGPTYGSRED